MKEDERATLNSIVIQIANLQMAAKALGLDYLGALLGNAREEAMDHFRDDALARSDRAGATSKATNNVVNFPQK